MHIPEKGPLPAHGAGERPPKGRPQSSQTATATASADHPRRDAVRLTEQSREVPRVVAQARSLPDVRADRVVQLKQQLAQGTYRVEGNRIAVSLIDESIENNSVLKHIDTKV